jgi:hypothetical protein
MKTMCIKIAITLLYIITIAVGQTVDAYDKDEKSEGKSFFDPSKLTINHAFSFGMSSSSAYSGLKHQSLYTTMMTYQFSNPVTLNLNFSLPIHSTYASEFNLNADNIQSLEYFKNIPFDAHLRWQPNEKFAVQLSVIRNTGAYPFYSPFYSPFCSPFYSPSSSCYSPREKSEKEENKEK